MCQSTGARAEVRGRLCGVSSSALMWVGSWDQTQVTRLVLLLLYLYLLSHSTSPINKHLLLIYLLRLHLPCALDNGKLLLFKTRGLL